MQIDHSEMSIKLLQKTIWIEYFKKFLKSNLKNIKRKTVDVQ